MKSVQISPKVEKQILQGVLKAIETKPPVTRINKLKEALILLGFGIIFFFLFKTFGSSRWFQELFPFATFAFGMVFMHIFIKAQQVFQWPVIGQYVDRAKVETRLRELIV
ncbi:hypothetical protein [Comamonas guangdongensis]|uniref:Uncharacterized protein n=1 Tax=Comamonas guangdongensis TaxID=510515 RepID=A0ABV4A0B0_9BURK